MPAPLSVRPASIPETRVPCHELPSTAQLANCDSVRSCEEIQSPGSDGSESQPLPSLAARAVPPDSALTKSYPGSSLPPSATASRSG